MAADESIGYGYAMVPVPEELFDDVNRHLLGLVMRAAGSLVQWSLDDVVALLDEADGEISEVVRAAAAATLSNTSLLDVELAGQLGISTRELSGLLREMNDTAPPGVTDLVVLHRSHRGDQVVREVLMTVGHAQIVREAATVLRRRRPR